MTKLSPLLNPNCNILVDGPQSNSFFFHSIHLTHLLTPSHSLTSLTFINIIINSGRAEEALTALRSEASAAVDSQAALEEQVTSLTALLATRDAQLENQSEFRWNFSLDSFRRR